jgi:hypothetical protein
MWRVFWAIELLVLGLVSCASAGSLYLTTPKPLANVGYTSNDSYTFIAPYFARVATGISVSIVKATAPGNSTAASSNPMAKEASPPQITDAKWTSTDGGQATFTVKCDLTSVLSQGTFIIVSGVDQSAFNGEHEVVSVSSNTVVAKQTASSQQPGKRGSITSANCPPASSASLSVTISVIPIPRERAYLLFAKRRVFQ